MKLCVLFRLTVCLVMFHGCGHVASEETDGRFREGGPREYPSVRDTEGQTLALGDVEEVVEVDDRKVEGESGSAGISVRGDGKPADPLEEGTLEVFEEAGEGFGKVGECVGKRFKKCR